MGAFIKYIRSEEGGGGGPKSAYFERAYLTKQNTVLAIHNNMKETRDQLQL